jgi:RimJ/RimL family protein N-acetyltransferase
MKSTRPDIQLLRPNVDRDAPFAHSWFTRSEGRATLVSMGNVESEIKTSTLSRERKIMQEFLDLEASGKQITRAIVVGGETIGFVWVELFENHGIKPPALHIMIGNPDYRGKGIGRAVMEAAINYVRDTLHHTTLRTRHLTSNIAIAKLNESLGFTKDGAPYADEDGLMWQNVILTL